MDVQKAHGRNIFFKGLKNYTAVVRANARSKVDGVQISYMYE